MFTELQQAVTRLLALQALVDLFITCQPYTVVREPSDVDEPGMLAGETETHSISEVWLN